MSCKHHSGSSSYTPGHRRCCEIAPETYRAWPSILKTLLLVSKIIIKWYKEILCDKVNQGDRDRENFRGRSLGRRYSTTFACHDNRNRKIPQLTGQSRALLKHPQALGRAEAARMEGTKVGIFVRTHPGSPHCQVTGILLGAQLSLVTHRAMRSGFFFSPPPEARNSESGVQGQSCAGSHHSLWDICSQTSYISSAWSCVPRRRNKRWYSPH